MLFRSHLRRAAGLLSLCLLTQCRLPVATGSLPVGDEARPGETPPKTRALPVSQGGPEAAAQLESEAARELFQDVEPKALAALLLQALQTEPETPGELHPGSFESHAERAPSRRPRPEEERTWAAGEEASRLSQRGQPGSPSPPAAATAKRDSEQAVLRELDESERLKGAPSKRRATPEREPWEGARKLRQQQHLEHQLLQRRYEELAESRRQAEEARRAAAEEERLADMASDLLLQYLLKDGDEEEEEQEGRKEGRSGEEEESRRRGSSLLFEDEEAGGNVAEDKRSNEAPEEEEEEEEEEGEGGEEEEEEGDDLDPNTIDRLIELSSKLHLPADDVIDIINDVEEQKKKKKVDAAPLPAGGRNGKEEGAPPLRSSSSSSSSSSSNKAKKRPVPAPPAPQPAPWSLRKPYYAPAYKPPSRRPKPEEAAWNEVLKGDEYPGGKGWQQAQPGPKISNAISRWTIPVPAPRPLRRPAVASREAEEEEEQGAGRPGKVGLEDYLESLLGKHHHFF